MSTRTSLTTRPAPYEARLAAWKAAVDAADEHVKKSLYLQKQGTAILANLDNLANNAEAAVKMTQAGSTILEKGMKMERDAWRERIALNLEEPKP